MECMSTLKHTNLRFKYLEYDECLLHGYVLD